MRIFAVFRNIIIFLLLLFLCGMVASAFVSLKPPACVVTTLFRMAFQITQKYLAPILTILFLICFTLICLQFKKGLRPGVFFVICTLILGICMAGTFISLLKLSNAKARKNNIKYTEAVAGSDRDIDVNSYRREDLSEEIGVAQCIRYISESSPYKDTCLIYTNYGGWSKQDEKMSTQVRSFSQKEGYTFVSIACDRQEDEQIDELLRDTNHAINQLLNNNDYRKVYLCGGSAGAHMALLSTYVDEENTFGAEELGSEVGGVIALYPCVDPAYNYDYYVNADTNKKNLIDKLGDNLYCSLYHGTTGTLGGETKKLDDQVFGERDDENSWYSSTRIAELAVKKDIPVLLVQGSKDSMIVPATVKDCYNELKAAGKTAVYLELPGAEHVFDMMPTSAWDRCEKEMTGFIRQTDLQ